MSDQRLARSGDSIAMVGYRGAGTRIDGSRYEAWCTTTYRAAGDDWRVIQHQQTPVEQKS